MNKKRKIRMNAWLIIGVLAFLYPATSLAENIAGNLDDIAKSMTTYFPKITGTVLEVNADTLTVALPEETGLTKGVLLSVYREEEPFYHPVTGVPLGRFETDLGLLEILHVEPHQVRARALDSTETLHPGDFVRLTRARIPIGVLGPTQKNDEGLIREFILALEETGRFSPTLSSLSDVDPTPASSPFYRATLETVTDPHGKNKPSYTVHIRLQNIKTQTILFDDWVDLAPVAESDFMIESFQRQHLRNVIQDAHPSLSDPAPLGGESIRRTGEGKEADHSTIGNNVTDR